MEKSFAIDEHELGTMLFSVVSIEHLLLLECYKSPQKFKMKVITIVMTGLFCAPDKEFEIWPMWRTYYSIQLPFTDLANILHFGDESTKKEMINKTISFELIRQKSGDLFKTYDVVRETKKQKKKKIWNVSNLFVIGMSHALCTSISDKRRSRVNIWSASICAQIAILDIWLHFFLQRLVLTTALRCCVN